MYPRVARLLTAENRIFEKAMQANIQQDDREIDYLTLFLEIQIQSGVTSAPEVSEEEIERLMEVARPIVQRVATRDLPLGEVIEKSSRLFIGVSQKKVSCELVFVDFPDNFYEFYQKFMSVTCSICSKKTKLALCLLCGHKCCIRSCTTPNADASDDIIGNCSIHSLNMHNGTCMFIVSDDGDVILYEGSRLFVLPSLFVNKFGQNFDSQNMKKKELSNFKKYSVDDNKMEGLKKILLEYGVIAYIIQNNLNLDMTYRNNYF